MPALIRYLLIYLSASVLMVLIFLGTTERLERRWVDKDIEQRTQYLHSAIQGLIINPLRDEKWSQVQKILNKVSKDDVLAGAVLCGRHGRTLAKSDDLPRDDFCSSTPKNQKLLSKELIWKWMPLSDEESLASYSILLLFDPNPLKSRIQIQKLSAIAAIVLISIFFLLAMWKLYRGPMQKTVGKVLQALSHLSSGNGTSALRTLKGTDFEPLVQKLDRMLSEVKRAKNNQADRTGSFHWTASQLRAEIQRLFPNSSLCVLANREPYIHNYRGSKIEVQFPASGLVTAVEPILRACSGLWIGHGSGTADRATADQNGILLVPPQKPEYALKRIWLSKEEEDGYYYGFSNEGLWPLCHIAHTRPLFRLEDWQQYCRVNQKFADAFALEMTSQRPIALIQDYHFALLPRLIQNTRPDAITSLFWHIPWPNPEVIGICPWKTEILEGMTGAHLIGFHTQFHCNNFLDTVDRFLEARVDRNNSSITIRGHTCYVKPFPISIEWPPRGEVAPQMVSKVREQLLSELGLDQSTFIGLGIDRIDYTKGILERLMAVDRLLEKHPDFVGKFVFIQIGAPSRTRIKSYQELNIDVQNMANRINQKYEKDKYKPILLRLTHHDSDQVFRYCRSADVCFISSLHDGMNLVAKEYIASRSDCNGALVLSSFTGAASELKDALIVNPYNIEESADALYRAINMNPQERYDRMLRLRQTIERHNVYAWAADFLREISAISERHEVSRSAFERNYEPLIIKREKVA